MSLLYFPVSFPLLSIFDSGWGLQFKCIKCSPFDILPKPLLVVISWLDEIYLVIDWSRKPCGYCIPWFLHAWSFLYNIAMWEITWLDIKYLVCIFLPWLIKNAAPLLLCSTFFNSMISVQFCCPWSYLIFLPESLEIFYLFFKTNNLIRLCLRIDGLGSTFTSTCWVFSVCRSSSDF